MKTTAEKAVEILRQYADETGVLPRSTSDLSKLEEWLILFVIAVRDNMDSK